MNKARDILLYLWLIAQTAVLSTIICRPLPSSCYSFFRLLELVALCWACLPPTTLLQLRNEHRAA